MAWVVGYDCSTGNKVNDSKTVGFVKQKVNDFRKYSNHNRLIETRARGSIHASDHYSLSYSIASFKKFSSEMSHRYLLVGH